MSVSTEQSAWQAYVTAELQKLVPLLQKHGYSLLKDQPHTKGERFLMQNITTLSGKKMILIGTNDRAEKVVIKVAKDLAGTQELIAEQKCRRVLQEINFAYETFDAPTELAFFTGIESIMQEDQNYQ